MMNAIPSIVRKPINKRINLISPCSAGSPPVRTFAFLHQVEVISNEGLSSSWVKAESRPKEAAVVQAGFGRYGWQVGPVPRAELETAPAREAVYSLTSGLFKDPVHIQTLGPKGHVSEEFIYFGETKPGEGGVSRPRKAVRWCSISAWFAARWR